MNARAIRVRDPRLINTESRVFCSRLLDAATRQPGLSKAEVDLPSASCLFEFGGGRTSSHKMAEVFAGCVAEASAGSQGSDHTLFQRHDADWLTLTAYPLADDRSLFSEGWQRGPTKPAVTKASATEVKVASGPKRVMYLALAGGAFAATVVALVIPGVPTVPFLLLTSYFLARSSPRLDAALRRSKFFGSIVVEWEQHGALSRHSKGKLIGLTAAIALVTIALSPLSPVAILLVLLVSSLGTYEINRLPALPDDEQGGNANDWLAGFALPVP